MALFSVRRFCLLKTKLNVKETVRWMSTSYRPLAALDQQVEESLKESNSQVKTRRHPGVFNRDIVRLPDQLKEAIDKIIADKSVTALYQSAKELNNHLVFKKPPMRPEDLNNLKLSCREKIDESSPLPIGISYLTEEDQKRILNSQNSKAKRLFNQKAYKWKPVPYNQSTALTYLVARLAPDYACLFNIFNEMSSRDPGFQPQSLFDFGSGIGSALWAAKSSWNPKHIKEVFCVDSSIDMNSLALALLQGGVYPSNQEETGGMNSAPIQKGLYFRQFMPTSSAIKYDLVVCAHTLLELPSAELRLQTVLSLWRKCQGYLVFVEHGSRAAYEVIAEVRDFLLSLSADPKSEANLIGHVFSPCAHESACPRLMADATPCNFEVRYEPLLLKENASYDVERFTYVVLKKGRRSSDDPQWPRVVRPVLSRSRHTICRLCTKEGKLDEVVITKAKHSAMTYQCARKTRWGDLLPVHLSPQDDSKEDATQETEH